MNIRRALRRWLFEEQDNVLQLKEKDCVPMPTGENAYDGINIKIITANGGRLIEISHYDNQIHERKQQLYIVNDEESLGTSIEQSLMLYKMSTGK